MRHSIAKWVKLTTCHIYVLREGNTAFTPYVAPLADNAREVISEENAHVDVLEPGGNVSEEEEEVLILEEDVAESHYRSYGGQWRACYG